MNMDQCGTFQHVGEKPGLCQKPGFFPVIEKDSLNDPGVLYLYRTLASLRGFFSGVLISLKKGRLRQTGQNEQTVKYLGALLIALNKHESNAQTGALAYH